MPRAITKRRLRRALAVGVLAATVGAITAIGSPASAAVPGWVALTTTKTAYVTGENATFKLQVSKKVNAPKATGTATFHVGASTVDVAVVSGAAVLSTRLLPLGASTVYADYSGDASYDAETTVGIAVNVSQGATTLKLSTNLVTVPSGKAANLTTVAKRVAPATGGTLAGTASYTATNDDGLVVSADLTSSATGTAAWKPLLADGFWKITASYAGNASFTGSTAEPFVIYVGVKPAVTEVAGGWSDCARYSNGRVRCWGGNAFGTLGNGTFANTTHPVAVTGLTGVTDLAAGSGHNCVVVDGGSVRCWGYNNRGQLGDGTWNHSAVPLTVPGITGATAVAAGDRHSCALIDDGTVRCWGSNSHGQLGDPTVNNVPFDSYSNTPVTVTGVSGAVAITADGYHTCALIIDGTARCWGSSWAGELGNGQYNSNSGVPVVVTGLTNAVSIDAGAAHTCAVISDGTARCWGQATSGQSGNLEVGTNVWDAPTPVVVTGLTGVTSISAGYDTTCARLTDGTTRCWGLNVAGQVGDGTTTNAITPVTVTGISDAIAVNASNFKTCALRGDGTVRCWGNGVLTPALVPGL